MPKNALPLKYTIEMVGDYAGGTQVFNTGVVPDYYDLDFEIITGSLPPPPSANNVPTLSEWGLIILALLLLTFGTLQLVQQGRRKEDVA